MTQYTTQIAIVGGGICGLWLLNLLRDAGYDAWLFEQNMLGCGQTLASQGLIHGGIKYALRGFTTPASESIASMPDTWRACLSGSGPLDFSNLPLYSESCYLFSDQRLSSKMTAFFASKQIAGRVALVSRHQYPTVFASPLFQGVLYQLQDFVIDTSALLHRLQSQYAQAIFRTSINTINETAQTTHLLTADGTTIKADLLILAAGAGNQALVAGTQLKHIAMQRRPLHLVMVKGELPALFAHAVSLKDASKPKITISSHLSQDGEWVWCLGGNLAEKGVGMSANKLILSAQTELDQLLPWLDLTQTKWATLMIDRAEPAQKLGVKPDIPFVERLGNVMVCWPTKLTLTPMLGQMVMKNLDFPPSSYSVTPPNLAAAKVAAPPWELAFA